MNRRGFHLVEVVVGVCLGAGVLISLVGLVQSNTRNVRWNEERAVTRGVLVELTDILMGESLDSLRKTAAGGSQALDDLLSRRIAKLSDPAMQQERRTQVAPLKGKLSLSLQESSGGHADLVRMRVSAAVTGSTLRVSRLFRESARPVVDTGSKN